MLHKIIILSLFVCFLLFIHVNLHKLEEMTVILYIQNGLKEVVKT